MIDIWLERQEQVAREDLVMFINACFACSGQREFYSYDSDRGVSIDFLHDYILGNYRLLYARTLAAGINHFNIAQIILKLLATGSKVQPKHRQEEGALIATALRNLPTQRAWKLLQEIRKRGINNRRSRAIARDYVKERKNITFDVVKYRSKVKAIAIHCHLKLEGEIGDFLFRNWQKKTYQTTLLEQYRQAHYSAESIYQLPFTIAEGFAVKHKIPREVFLNRIQEKMTQTEKLRWQQTSDRLEKVEIDLDWERLPLTKLALYILSLTKEVRIKKYELLEKALKSSAQNTLKIASMQLGKVAAVLDCSYSSSGSSEKRRRPLGVALAAHYLLQGSAKEYRAFWTNSIKDTLLIKASGQTDLATPLLDALAWKADLIIIISDGCENDPPQGAAEILRVYRQKLDPTRKTAIVHCNPVFDGSDFVLNSISNAIPTVGLRDAEDLPTMLNFARFAEGNVSLSELENYFLKRANKMLFRLESE
jgi:hypothetical protein